jgi:hypothetical protein
VHIARTFKDEKCIKTFVGNREGKRTLERHRRRFEYNMTVIIDLILYECVNGIDVARSVEFL